MMIHKEVLLLAIPTLTLTAIGLAVIPFLDQANVETFVSGSKNQSKQGDLKSDTRREGLVDHNHTGFPCPYRVIHCYGSGSNDHPFRYSPTQLFYSL